VVFDGDATPDGTTVATVNPGQPTEVNMGLVGSAQLGNLVFLDENGNDLRDPTEPGVGSVGIIATWAGPDGVIGTADDVVYSAIADGNGIWGIDSLPAGAFVITVDPDTLPSGVRGRPQISATLDAAQIIAIGIPLDPPRSLPVTGGSAGVLVLFSLTLILTGYLVLAASRRREDEPLAG
jgi:hypothetical protein